MKGKHDTVKRERSTQTAKSISIEMPELEKISRNRRNIKNTAATKGKAKHMTRGRTQKHESKEKTLQQEKQIAHLRSRSTRE